MKQMERFENLTDDRLIFATLPVSWYVDPEVFALEMRAIFSSASEYVGCVPMVPESGWIRTIPQSDHAEMLVRDGENIRLLSNICLHRSMLMMQGRDKLKALTCPMHLWSYDLSGRLLKAQHYPDTPCLNLPKRPLQNWNGILFAGERDVADDLSELGGRPELDMSRYVLVQSEQEEQPINWKIPVEVLLENYHVPIIHPGLSRYVDPSTWYGTEGEFESAWLSYQEMRPHSDFINNPASPVFERWQRAILKILGGEPPSFATIISLYYPNIFLEWYPFTFVVTTYTPRSPESSLMTRDFFYDPQALEAVAEFPELAKAAWDENQLADDIAHKALQQGRSLRFKRNPHDLSGYEVYQSPTEESVQLFHSKLMRTLAANGVSK